MAKIVLIGLEHKVASQICRAVAADDHQFAEHPQNVAIRDLLDADIVFAGEEPDGYMPL